MSKKIIAALFVFTTVLTGCSNSGQNNASGNGLVSDPFANDPENSSSILSNPFKTQVNYSIGLKSDEAKFIGGETLQIPLSLKSDEESVSVGVKVYVDGILQEFSFDDSQSYSDNNIMCTKTDDTNYQLEINAKFDENIETHTISALSVYNPEFKPQPGMSLGNNHKGAAGGFRFLPTGNTPLEFSDSKVILKADSPSPITNEQLEKYRLKGENSQTLLLMQSVSGNTYALNKNGSSVLLQFVLGTQIAGSEKYRVSFYKNHNLVPFNGDYLYLDVSSEGGKISITDIEINDVKDGDFLYCIAVPTASYNEFAYPKKTDTIVVVDAE